MNYYSHHIGDYDSHTAHLEWVEDMAYTRLLRLYYRTEKPIPADLSHVCRLVRAKSKDERKAVQTVLAEYFQLLDDGWHNDRADKEITKYQAKASANRENGKAGGRPKQTEEEPKNNPDGFGLLTQKNLNQEPRTKNQEPRKEKDSTLRVADDPVKAEIWQTGKALLEAEGMTKDRAGSFLGKQVKDFGQMLMLQAIRDCVTATPAKPSEWLIAHCQQRRAAAGSKVDALERRNMEAVRIAMREVGNA